MTKKTENAYPATIVYMDGHGTVTRQVTAFAEVGPFLLHETVDDYRLAEAKSAAFSVTHAATGLGLINGVQTKKVALAFAEEAVVRAQELGLELGEPSLGALQSQPAYEAWVEWALAARAELKTRKGFLYG